MFSNPAMAGLLNYFGYTLAHDLWYNVVLNGV